ncbi:MAG: HNH endonuclease [Chloroflexota bacterium]
MFRDFKRHYHKVRDVVDKLADKDPFKLQVKFDGTNLQAEYKSPDNEDTVRFVVLMRRFLNPLDSLYYRKVWMFLQEKFADEISVETVKHIESVIENLNTGRLSININGENMTAEKIYQILSDGNYFNQNENAQKYLRSLANLPIVGPLFWHQFHEYTLEGYTLVYILFDIISQVEKSARYQTLHSSATPQTAQCIYCLTKIAVFSSEEHIFPESLGNDELILPKGYVCDKCNNGILARLDNALIKFEPVGMLQVQFVPYTKEGKLPKANFQNITMERTSPTNIHIKAKDKTGQIKNKKHLGDDWYSFSIQMKGKKFNPIMISRSLYKIALGIVALSQGHEQACNQKYDLARDFILKGKGFPNNLIIQTKCNPHPQVRVAYNDLPEGTPFVIDIYGLVFLLNLETGPVLELNDVINHCPFAEKSG